MPARLTKKNDEEMEWRAITASPTKQLLMSLATGEIMEHDLNDNKFIDILEYDASGDKVYGSKCEFEDTLDSEIQANRRQGLGFELLQEGDVHGRPRRFHLR